MGWWHFSSPYRRPLEGFVQILQKNNRELQVSRILFTELWLTGHNSNHSTANFSFYEGNGMENIFFKARRRRKRKRRWFLKDSMASISWDKVPFDFWALVFLGHMLAGENIARFHLQTLDSWLYLATLVLPSFLPSARTLSQQGCVNVVVVVVYRTLRINLPRKCSAASPFRNYGAQLFHNKTTFHNENR